MFDTCNHHSTFVETLWTNFTPFLHQFNFSFPIVAIVLSTLAKMILWFWKCSIINIWTPGSPSTSSHEYQLFWPSTDIIQESHYNQAQVGIEKCPGYFDQYIYPASYSVSAPGWLIHVYSCLTSHIIPPILMQHFLVIPRVKVNWWW